MVQLRNFTRVNNDTNGNPRYVCHFLRLLNQQEASYKSPLSLSEQYDMALKRAKKVGGKKFHNKQYGGGISFVSYNLVALVKKNKRLLTQLITAGGSRKNRP